MAVNITLTDEQANDIMQTFWESIPSDLDFKAFSEWMMETYGAKMTMHTVQGRADFGRWYIPFDTAEEAVEFKLKWL